MAHCNCDACSEYVARCTCDTCHKYDMSTRGVIMCTRHDLIVQLATAEAFNDQGVAAERERDALRARVATLETALREIAKEPCAYQLDATSADPPDVTCKNMVDDCDFDGICSVCIARAALADTTKEKP